MRIDREAIAILLFTAVAAFIAISTNMPSSTPYSPYNTGDYGYSKLLQLLCCAEVVRTPMEISKANVSVILPVTRKVELSGYEELIDVVLAGGTIVILDEEGYSNDLLRFLGLKARIEGHKVLDEVVKLSSREYPIASLYTDNQTTRYVIATYRPSYIAIENVFDKGFTGVTSNYAYADIDRNSYYTVGEEMKNYTIVWSARVGSGCIWVVADLDVLSNRLVDKLDNSALLRMLTGSRRVYILVDGIELKSLDLIKYSLYRIFRAHGFAGSIILNAVIFILLLAVFMVVRYAEQRF